MKQALIVFALIVLFGCANIVQPPVLLDAVWEGQTITTLTSHGVLRFAAPATSGTGAAKVHIYESEGQWYIWKNGYGLKITLLEEAV